MPVLVIGLPGTAGTDPRLRANLLDELNKQYVTTGRAKGLPAGRLLIKYPLRISLNPFIADIGSLLPELISGSVIVSVVMSLPLTGPMLLDALRSQDMYLGRLVPDVHGVPDRGRRVHLRYSAGAARSAHPARQREPSK